MKFRDTLIRKFAEQEAKKLARKTIKYLQSLKDNNLLSGDDTELESVWDEFCVQVQGENSFYWDAYVETAKQFINGYAELLPIHVNQAIWLQTDEGFEWTLDNENEKLDFYGSIDSITDYIFNTHLLFLAETWTNKRIELFIEKSNYCD
jgi:hypothetical protein